MLKKSSELRQKEHLDSTINIVEFDGSMETIPYKVGDLYQGREIYGIAFTKTGYGHYYDLLVESDRAHVRTRFTFDSKHDLKNTKPLEKPTGAVPKNFELPHLIN